MTTLAIAILAFLQGSGIPPEWEVRPKVEKIPPEIAKIEPLLNQLQPEKWIAAGAPEAYRKQWQDCLAGVRIVQETSARLAAKPNRLSLAVETLVRMETLLQHASSISQAVRRYQNPAMAELLDGEILAAGASRDWLRQHVLELSMQREKELEVAEQEADRCRANLSRPGARK